MNIANHYIISWLPPGLRRNSWEGLSSWPNRIGFYVVFGINVYPHGGTRI